MGMLDSHLDDARHRLGIYNHTTRRIGQVDRQDEMPARVRLHEPPDVRIKRAPVHVDDAHIVQVLVAHESAINSMPMELTDNEFIQRVERARGDGWEVKARHGSLKKTQVFLDKRFGGAGLALQVARAWRDEALKAMRDRAAKLEPKQARRRRNPPEKPRPRAHSAERSESILEDAKQAIKKRTGHTLPRVAEIKRHESLTPAIDGRPPRVSAFWTASWTDASGSSQTRKFSVNYWGEERARQKAMEVHAQHLLQAQVKALRDTPKKSTPPREPAEDEMRYIRRVNARGSHSSGWEVKIKRANVRKSRFFADSVHGGKEPALAAAKAWRAQMLPQMDGPEYEVWKRKQLIATNTSGIPGIYRGVAGKKRNGRYVKTPYWQGYWTDMDGKRRSRVFSINAYGEEGAKALALQFRRSGIEEVAREAALRQAAFLRSSATPA